MCSHSPFASLAPAHLALRAAFGRLPGRFPPARVPIPHSPFRIPHKRASAGNPSALSSESSAIGHEAASPISYLLSSKRRFAAFTLIELLVVISIIGILAALVIAAMGGVQKQGPRAAAESDIQALAAAIEEYQREFGTFPPTASNALYAELTTDSSAGIVPANTRIVFFEPRPGIVNTNTPGRKFFQDPWEAAYGYSTNSAGFFQVWSTAGGASSNQWIRN